MGITERPWSSVEEWLELRKALGIGGSEAAAAADASPWMSAHTLALIKMGDIPGPEENEAMRRGSLFEPVVRQMYCDETGDEVTTPSGIVQNIRFPFAFANLDGRVVGKDKLLECKTATTRRGWGQPGTSEIPLTYLFQVQHYMGVAEAPACDVAVLFGNFELAIYPVEADAEFQAMLFEVEAEFWDRVQRRDPPSPVTNADALRRWPTVKQAVGVEATEEDRRVASLLAEMKERIGECQAWQERAEACLKARIGDYNSLLYGDEVIATWNQTKGRTTFDSKAFAAKHPKVYARYTKTGNPGRTFLLKETPCLLTGTHKQTLSAPPLPTLPEPG